jgi:hypothetical protein
LAIVSGRARLSDEARLWITTVSSSILRNNSSNFNHRTLTSIMMRLPYQV